jgi:cytochrome c
MTSLLPRFAVVLFVTAAALPAHAEGDPERGEAVFNKCKICHAVGEGAKRKIGPPLNDIIGATAGTQEDFSYSSAMKAKGEDGLVWSEETLSEYLLNPRKAVPGTKMVFPGLKKDSDRENVIAYLKQFSEQ